MDRPGGPATGRTGAAGAGPGATGAGGATVTTATCAGGGAVRSAVSRSRSAVSRSISAAAAAAPSFAAARSPRPRRRRPPSPSRGLRRSEARREPLALGGLAGERCLQAGALGLRCPSWRQSGARRLRALLAGHKTRTVFDRYAIVSHRDLHTAVTLLEGVACSLDPHSAHHGERGSTTGHGRGQQCDREGLSWRGASGRFARDARR